MRICSTCCLTERCRPWLSYIKTGIVLVNIDDAQRLRWLRGKKPLDRLAGEKWERRKKSFTSRKSCKSSLHCTLLNVQLLFFLNSINFMVLCITG